MNFPDSPRKEKNLMTEDGTTSLKRTKTRAIVFEKKFRSNEKGAFYKRKKEKRETARERKPAHRVFASREAVAVAGKGISSVKKSNERRRVANTEEPLGLLASR